MYKKIRLQVRFRVPPTAYTGKLATCHVRVSRAPVAVRKLDYVSLEHSKTTSRVQPLTFSLDLFESFLFLNNYNASRRETEAISRFLVRGRVVEQ
jgi:hypothetical protein